MPAGPQLDEWVAVAIGHDVGETIPPISTDLTWAMLALERLPGIVAWDIGFSHDSASYKRYCCRLSETEHFDDPKYVVGWAVANTAPLAIARAILMSTVKV